MSYALSRLAMTRTFGVVLAVGALSSIACSLVLGIDSLHDCVGIECDGGDASGDAGGDAQADASDGDADADAGPSLCDASFLDAQNLPASLYSRRGARPRRTHLRHHGHRR